MEPEQPIEEPTVPPPSSGDVGQHVDFKPPNTTKSNRHILRWFGIVLVVLILSGIAVLVLKPGHKSPSKTASSQSTDTQAATEPNVPTKNYVSTTYNLSFDYPEAWTVKDDGSTPLTVTSPLTKLTDATGKEVAAEEVMTIQPQGQVPQDFNKGNAAAVRDSEKVNYTKPTASQRAQTYLSFLQYAATPTHGALDGIYITGNVGYKHAQPVPSTDIAPRDPIVFVTFVKCANSTCSGTTTPLSIKSTAWDSNSFKAPIKIMLTSLAFN